MSCTNYIHFACHGKYEPEAPLASAVILAHGKRLTLADLYAQAAFEKTRLVVLSACQTAITDFDQLPEEAIGLSAGFLRAGVSGVIGSLWPVDDLSTTLLMIKLYEYQMTGDPEEHICPMPPVQALRQAQIWLRNITNGKLSHMFDAYRKRSPNHRGIDQALANKKFTEYTLNPPNSRPFKKSYHWAGFAFYGT